MTARALPVVARCQNALPDYYGGYVRGAVFMRGGQFLAGTEELDVPDSLVADAFKPDTAHAYSSIEDAKLAADALAEHAARFVPPQEPLPDEYDITKTPQSVECSEWRSIDECNEVKTHVGELHEPNQDIQFFAGIERSHQGGDCDISWSGPFASREDAGKAADDLFIEADASATSYTEPDWSSVRVTPGMR